MMSVTMHIEGVGHRRFCGHNAQHQAEQWANQARTRPDTEDEAEEARRDKLERTVSSKTAKLALAFVKKAERTNTVEVAQACHITRPTAARILQAAGELGMVVDYGQKGPRLPKEWGVE